MLVTVFVSPLDEGSRDLYPLAMTDQTVHEIIKARGGSTVVARALCRPGHTVRKQLVHIWIQKNKIPWWRREQVMALPLQDSPRRKSATRQSENGDQQQDQAA